MNYFELYPLFALLPKLMTNQSYAQVTIACKTIESPILHLEYCFIISALRNALTDTQSADTGTIDTYLLVLTFRLCFVFSWLLHLKRHVEFISCSSDLVSFHFKSSIQPKIKTGNLTHDMNPIMSATVISAKINLFEIFLLSFDRFFVHQKNHVQL